MTKNGFAKRLKDLRRQKDFSQAELGRLTDLHYTHIGRYERGISKPSTDTLIKLAEVLGVTTDYLIEGATGEVAKAKLEDRELLYQFQEIEKLPEDDKMVVKKFLDAFITKKKVQSILK